MQDRLLRPDQQAGKDALVSPRAALRGRYHQLVTFSGTVPNS